MGLLIFYVLLAVGVSFLCSTMEAVLLSVTPSYVAGLEQEGDPSGERLRDLKENVDRPLAAILSLNTVANTIGATGVGAQATKLFGSASVGIVAAVFTLVILIFAEIIPKTLGAVHWRRLAPAIERLLRFIIFAMLPLVWLSNGVTRLMASDEPEASVSREEFSALAERGKQEGVFEEEESRILKNLFRFSSLRVKDIMTPRTVIEALPEHQTIAEVVEARDEFRFSRLPVYTESHDDIIGYVLKDDILLKAAQEEDHMTLRQLKREIMGVPEEMPLPEAFENLLDRSEHIALVVDEYGGTAGIVTMEDVVETLLGLEIVDEADSAQDMQVLAREQWLRRARRLGLVPEHLEDASSEVRDAVARLGITGGEPSAVNRADFSSESSTLEADAPEALPSEGEPAPDASASSVVNAPAERDAPAQQNASAENASAEREDARERE